MDLNNKVIEVLNDEHGQKVELTLQDISDGKGVGVATHLIRIKE